MAHRNVDGGTQAPASAESVHHGISKMGTRALPSVNKKSSTCKKLEAQVPLPETQGATSSELKQGEKETVRVRERSHCYTVTI